jgi:hypothetical protein
MTNVRGKALIPKGDATHRRGQPLPPRHRPRAGAMALPLHAPGQGTGHGPPCRRPGGAPACHLPRSWSARRRQCGARARGSTGSRAAVRVAEAALAHAVGGHDGGGLPARRLVREAASPHRAVGGVLREGGKRGGAIALSARDKGHGLTRTVTLAHATAGTRGEMVAAGRSPWRWFATGFR